MVPRARARSRRRRRASSEIAARLDLARKRAAQYRELAATGAGTASTLEQAETNVGSWKNNSRRHAARRRRRGGAERAGGHGRRRPTTVGAKEGTASTRRSRDPRAQLESAQWDLDRRRRVRRATAMSSTLQLRPGGLRRRTAGCAGDDAGGGNRAASSPSTVRTSSQSRRATRRVRAPTDPGRVIKGDGRFGDLGAGRGPDAGHGHPFP